MNFQKYEQEVKSFLTENYTNLKRAKVEKSEFALKELLLTERADINNYASSIVKKIVSDARKNFALKTDTEKAYEMARDYKLLIKAPTFKEIEVNYFKSDAKTLEQQHNFNSEEKPKRLAMKNFEEKSPFINSSAIPMAVGAGIATTVVGLPSAVYLTPASFATSLIIVSLSAVVVAGIVYTLVRYIDESGKEQQAYVQPKQTVSVSKPSPASVKKTIDQVSMGQLLDLRMVEAEQVLLRTIQEAKKKYEEMQLQLI